jgi:protein-S-isoprenylcysteine O-methyltransferase Ste14
MDSGTLKIEPVTGWRALLQPRVLDRIEQAAILLLWIWLVQRVWFSANPFAPLILLAETTVMVFVLIRRPTTSISVRLGDWLLATTATAAPLLIMPGIDLFPRLTPFAIGLVLVGNCFQIWAKLFLRRSFGIAPANRGIKSDGPYRFVRHPMYAGYLLVHIGILLLMPSLLNLAIYAIGWWAQVLRLLAEERLLSEDPAYRAFIGKVRWRLVPGVF